jgi:hypothetical protein
MIDLLLGLACLLAALVPFVMIYWLSRANDSRSSSLVEEMNDTWLAQVVKAVLKSEPQFDEPPPRPPPPPPPLSWPPTVRELAQAYANGADCAFALHDALIDAGFSHLAVEFSEADYAQDCDVIRWILK